MNLGQLNLVQVSSFCGPEGLIWGYDIAVHCRANIDAAREVAAEIEARGRVAAVFQADLAAATDRERLVAELRQRFESLELLVNNAGAAPRVRADILDLTEERFDDTFDTNFRGAFFLTAAIARWMLETR